MADTESQSDVIEQLADEFVERLRHGERPSAEDYVARFPELGPRIRRLFPLMQMMEAEARDQADDRASDGGLVLDRLGDFRIVREIGRGGMGVVYEADQESLGRRVALKVLTAHSRLDPRRLQRFEQEARTAAMLHHTNIVPVFGVGRQDGMCYYVMQFINGPSLDQVLVELRRIRRDGLGDTASAAGHGPSSETGSAVHFAQALSVGGFGSPSKLSHSDLPTAKAIAEQTGDGSSLSSTLLPTAVESSGASADGHYFRSVARIGKQAAEALHYAHAHGVLHRDVKPSNLLLDEQGTVWVMDFGLAKLSSSDALTHTGELVGTLRYLPPERWEGRSDERSDIFSLGATLYEMLTLEPAFDSADRRQVIQQITRAEPPAPRSVDAHIPRDLETIVLKAMAPDPRSRYASAGELAEDLGRFLESEPIRARRVSLLERSLLWARRHPATATLTAAVAFVAAVGVSGVVWQWREAVAAQSKLRTALDEKSAALTDAEESARTARRVSQILTEVFSDVDLAGAATDFLMDVPQITVVRATPVELLQRAAARLTEFDADPQTQVELLEKLAGVYLSLGRLTDAAPLMETAEGLRRQHGIHDAQQRHLRLRVALRFLQGRYDEARNVVSGLTPVAEGDEENRGLMLALIDMAQHESDATISDFERRLRDATDPARQRSPQAIRKRGIFLGYIGFMRVRRDEWPKAKLLGPEALACLAQIPGGAQFGVELGSFYMGLTPVESGDRDAGLKQIRAGLDGVKRLLGETHPVAMILEIETARYFRMRWSNKGKDPWNLERSFEFYEQSLATLAKACGRERRTADCHEEYGKFLIAVGRRDEGIPQLEQALSIRREVYGEHHAETRRAREVLSDVRARNTTAY
jgi:serine/threonine protein kinase